jgi:hypothetical protein
MKKCAFVAVLFGCAAAEIAAGCERESVSLLQAGAFLSHPADDALQSGSPPRKSLLDIVTDLMGASDTELGTKKVNLARTLEQGSTTKKTHDATPHWHFNLDANDMHGDPLVDSRNGLHFECVEYNEGGMNSGLPCSTPTILTGDSADQGVDHWDLTGDREWVKIGSESYTETASYTHVYALKWSRNMNSKSLLTHASGSKKEACAYVHPHDGVLELGVLSARAPKTPNDPGYDANEPGFWGSGHQIRAVHPVSDDWHLLVVTGVSAHENGVLSTAGEGTTTFYMMDRINGGMKQVGETVPRVCSGLDFMHIGHNIGKIAMVLDFSVPLTMHSINYVRSAWETRLAHLEEDESSG